MRSPDNVLENMLYCSVKNSYLLGGGVTVLTEGCGVEMIVPTSDTESLSEGSGVATTTVGDGARGGVGTGVASGLCSMTCEI